MSASPASYIGGTPPATPLVPGPLSQERSKFRQQTRQPRGGRRGRRTRAWAPLSGDMISRMTTPGPNAAAGSVGTVDTQFLDLPAPVPLECGRALSPVRIAYESYGELSPARDNVILVCHALSGDAHAAGFSRVPAGESTRDGFRAQERDGSAGRGLGWWDGMIGPGKALD